MKTALTFGAVVALAAPLATPAFAQEGIETLIGQVSSDAQGGAQVHVRLLNTGTAAQTATMPENIEARLVHGGVLWNGADRHPAPRSKRTSGADDRRRQLRERALSP